MNIAMVVARNSNEKKVLSFVAATMLSMSLHASQVESDATLVTGVTMGYSVEKTQPILIKDKKGTLYEGEAKNDSPMTKRIQIRLLKQCIEKNCTPLEGYVVDADGIVGVRATTMISQHASAYAMSSVVTASIAKKMTNDNNVSFAEKEKLIKFYTDMAEQASPYMQIDAGTSVKIVVK
jgi:hypothetical protein